MAALLEAFSSRVRKREAASQCPGGSPVDLASPGTRVPDHPVKTLQGRLKDTLERRMQSSEAIAMSLTRPDPPAVPKPAMRSSISEVHGVSLRQTRLVKVDHNEERLMVATDRVMLV